MPYSGNCQASGLQCRSGCHEPRGPACHGSPVQGLNKRLAREQRWPVSAGRAVASVQALGVLAGRGRVPQAARWSCPEPANGDPPPPPLTRPPWLGLLSRCTACPLPASRGHRRTLTARRRASWLGNQSSACLGAGGASGSGLGVLQVGHGWGSGQSPVAPGSDSGHSRGAGVALAHPRAHRGRVFVWGRWGWGLCRGSRPAEQSTWGVAVLDFCQPHTWHSST